MGRGKKVESEDHATIVRSRRTKSPMRSLTARTAADDPMLTVRDENGKFLSGHSGNPAGRPRKGNSLAEMIRARLELPVVAEKLDEEAFSSWSAKEVFVEQLVRQACRGDRHAQKLIMSYVVGVPVQRLEHGGAGGGPMSIVFPQEFGGV